VIEKVVLPLSITYVLKQAFDGCVRLTQINIPKRVEWIRGFCFDGCVSLTKIHLPISVAHIGVGAFDECRNLEIYTDHIDKQTGWANSWNKGNRPVFWAGQWKWVNGVPSQISDRKTN
jgi:hypothetical protein